MSDRINRITVILEKDIRDDDCEPILNAIRMVKGVAAAKPNIADARDFMAEERARQELTSRIWAALKPK